MKLDPQKLAEATKAWAGKHGKFILPGIVAVFVLSVLVVNARAYFGHGNDSPKASAPPAATPAKAAPAKLAQEPASHGAPIPQIAQRPATPTATPPAVAVTAAAPVPVAAPIQPPAGVRRGYIVEKRYQEDQFGTQVLTATNVVGVQSVSVQAPSTDTGFSGPATSVDWAAWINLSKPVRLAWLRLGGGQGTVTASVDGVSLGNPIEHWQTSGPTSTMSTVELPAGWHQIKIHDDRAHWVNGQGVAVRIDFGDGASDPVSPQPWAVPPGAPATGAIPQIAQHEPASASSAPAALPAASTTAGGAP